MTQATDFARRAGLILALSAAAFAAPAAAQTAKPAQKPAQAAPAQQAPAQPAPGQQAAQQEVPLVTTPWTKVCQMIPEQKKEACVISQSVQMETGQFLVSVEISEMKDEPRKALRVFVPLGMRLQPGMRLTIDQQPTAVPYSICIPVQGGVCVGEAEVNAELIGKLKKGQAVYIQALNATGRPFNIPLSMKDFAKAYDGPASDPNVVAQERQKLAEGLQKKAEERARAAAAAQGGAAPAAAPAAAAPK